MKTIGLIALMGLMLVGCDGSKQSDAEARLKVVTEYKVKAEAMLKESQAEARRHRVRISELELDLSRAKNELVAVRRDLKDKETAEIARRARGE